MHAIFYRRASFFIYGVHNAQRFFTPMKYDQAGKPGSVVCGNLSGPPVAMEAQAAVPYLVHRANV